MKELPEFSLGESESTKITTTTWVPTIITTANIKEMLNGRCLGKIYDGYRFLVDHIGDDSEKHASFNSKY